MKAFTALASCVAIAVLLLMPSQAFAEAPALAFKLNGIDGVWLPTKTAAEALKAQEKLPKLQALSDSQQRLIDAQKLVIRTSTASTRTALDLVAEEKALAKDLTKAPKETSIMESPVTWGIVSGVLVAVGFILFYHSGSVTVVK